MSKMAEFYGLIARNAGLDECEESTLDAVSGACEIAGTLGLSKPIDVLDFAVDYLLPGDREECVAGWREMLADIAC